MTSRAGLSSDLHIAVVGAGALGCTFGVRAADAAVRVSFVVRSAMNPVAAMRISRVGSSQVHRLQSPCMVEHIPSDAHIVVLAVRADNVDSALRRLVDEGPSVATLSLTPLMPSNLSALRAAVGERLIPMMPGIVAYNTGEQGIRYWLPRSAPTLIDASGKADQHVSTLVERLDRSGVPVRFAPRVDTLNPATIITFLPLVLALDAAGGTAEAALVSPSLGSAISAMDECKKLAQFVGRVPGWVDVLARFIGPRMLKIGVALARKSYPESLQFVEQHFGKKTHAQNVLLAQEVIALGKQYGLRMGAFEGLAQACKR